MRTRRMHSTIWKALGLAAAIGSLPVAARWCGAETPPIPPKLDGEKQAQLVKLACSQPPKGRARWTMQLLAERLVQLEIVDEISHETVRRALKKMSLSLGSTSSGASRR